MHINVFDLLAQDLGTSRDYRINDERPELDLIKLTQSISGELSLTRLERSIVAEGRVATGIELECHRCLRTFDRPVSVRFSRSFAEDPQDEELPIDPKGMIDVGEMLQQEILVSLPIKLLCQDDCAGILTGDAPQRADRPTGDSPIRKE